VERLVEFGFPRVAGDGGAEDVVDVSLNVHVSRELSAWGGVVLRASAREAVPEGRTAVAKATPEVVGVDGILPALLCGAADEAGDEIDRDGIVSECAAASLRRDRDAARRGPGWTSSETSFCARSRSAA
jgi:hypothetical protein